MNGDDLTIPDPDFDPRRPLPGELSPERRRAAIQIASAVALLGAGVAMGVWFAPETPAEDRDRIAALQAQLAQAKARAADLERTLLYQAIEAPAASAGHLSNRDRQRHLRKGGEYAAALRRAKAQAAAELLEWFVPRWNKLLDMPEEDDRISRRAATLSLFVAGMSETLDPADFVSWQAEFFGGRWLGEVHMDIDGDGLPGSRAGKNRREGFAGESVCHIAMALNQATTDARVLMMPGMRCDRPEARMSVFLGGETFDDAIGEFVVALRRLGFVVVEQYKKGIRLILVSAAPR